MTRLGGVLGSPAKANSELQSPVDARVHDLKIWPVYFDALADGRKTFEYRRNDRDYAVGDVLHLREWEPLAESNGECGAYTGRTMARRVTYMHATGRDFVVMALTRGEASGYSVTPGHTTKATTGETL
jgi:hypothetical protein